MITRFRIVSLACVAAGLAGGPVYAADVSTPVDAGAAPAAAGHQWQGGHRHHRGELRRVLTQLNLTPEQKTQIKSILLQAKTDLSARHANARANHEALAATSPNDPGYPALLATEKSNAAARVQTASDLKTQIYAVLTSDQQAKIPSLIAADRAARQARIAAWRAEHSS